MMNKQFLRMQKLAGILTENYDGRPDGTIKIHSGNPSSMEEGPKTYTISKKEIKKKVEEMLMAEMDTNTKDFASTPVKRPDGTYELPDVMKEGKDEEEAEKDIAAAEEEIGADLPDQGPSDRDLGDVTSVDVNSDANKVLQALMKVHDDSVALGDKTLTQQISNTVKYLTNAMLKTDAAS